MNIFTDKVKRGPFCKYSSLWHLNTRSCEGWSSNSFQQHIINFDVSEESQCRRLSTFYNKLTIIGSNLSMYTFVSKKKFIEETLNLPFVPHNVTLNNNYVACTSLGLYTIIIYKKKESYHEQWVIAGSQKGCLISGPHKKLKAVVSGSEKLKSRYLKAEVVVGKYLWVKFGSTASNIYCLLVVNLESFEVRNVLVSPRFLYVTRQRVIILSDKNLYVCDFGGLVQFELNYRFHNIRATDHYIVGTIVHENETDKSLFVWSMDDGTLVQSIPQPYYYCILDSKRHLLYGCDDSDDGTCRLNALDLRMGNLVWSHTIEGLQVKEIDEIYFVCDKFLVLDTYPQTTEPCNHFGYVYDLDKQCLLYKLPLNGCTLFVSDNLWVLKRQNNVTVNVY